jgi:hypothetical protein
MPIIPHRFDQHGAFRNLWNGEILNAGYELFSDAVRDCAWTFSREPLMRISALSVVQHPMEPLGLRTRGKSDSDHESLRIPAFKGYRTLEDIYKPSCDHESKFVDVGGLLGGQIDIEGLE